MKEEPEATPSIHNRDLVMEAHLRAIGMWTCFLGLLLVVGAGLAIFHLARNPAGDETIMAGVTAATGVFAYVLGSFIRRFSPTACTIVGILVLLSMATLFLGGGTAILDDLGLLLMIPLAWYVAVMFVLFSDRAAEICTEEYHSLVASTREVKSPMVRSPFFWIPAGAMALLIFMWARAQLF